MPPVAGRQVFFRDDVRVGNGGGQCRDVGGFAVEVSRPGTLDARVRWTDGLADLTVEVFRGAFRERIAAAQRPAGAFCADASAPVQPGGYVVSVCHTAASRVPVSFTGPLTGFELTVLYP